MKDLKSRFEEHQLKNPYTVNGGKRLGGFDTEEDLDTGIVLRSNRGKRKEDEEGPA